MRGLSRRSRIAGLALALALGAPAAAGARDAYVANGNAGDVSVIDTATNTSDPADDIAVGDGPRAIAITPDGATAYVSSLFESDVSVIDTATNSSDPADDIAVGGGPRAIAITPDGASAYVVNNFDGDVSVIDTATNTVTETIHVSGGPQAIAITPDGATAYVTRAGADTVSVIDTATNTFDPADDIAVGAAPQAIAITPDGATAYVVNNFADDVSVIDIATNSSDPADDIAVGDNPVAIAITPDGATAYVSNLVGDDDVSIIDTATNSSDPADDIAVGKGPFGIAITPDGATAYVANSSEDDVSVIDTATNTFDPADDIFVGTAPQAIAITPNQPPIADLSADPLTVPTGIPVDFDASGSSDDEGITDYSYDFGDGDSTTTANDTETHPYTTPGTYEATVTVDDGEGCSPLAAFFPPNASPFTGQTAHCNGPSTDTSVAVAIEVTDVPAYAELVLDSGPAAYWRLGESSGTSAADASANGNDGTYAGGHALGFAGAIAADPDTAVELTNAKGRIETPYSPFAKGSKRSYEGWAFREEPEGFGVLFSGPRLGNSPALYTSAGDPKRVRFDARAEGGSAAVGWADALPDDGAWFHWVLRFDDAANTAELFVNGVSKGTRAVSEPYHSHPGAFRAGNYAAKANSWNGALDEVAVYEDLLDAATVCAHYEAGAGIDAC